MADEKNPHDVIGIPGILKSQRKELEAMKVDIRMENEQYLREHPELNAMMSLFMRTVLRDHPSNLIEFAGSFFDRDELRELVYNEMNPQVEQYPEEFASEEPNDQETQDK